MSVLTTKNVAEIYKMNCGTQQSSFSIYKTDTCTPPLCFQYEPLTTQRNPSDYRYRGACKGFPLSTWYSEVLSFLSSSAINLVPCSSKKFSDLLIWRCSPCSRFMNIRTDSVLSGQEAHLLTIPTAGFLPQHQRTPSVTGRP